MSMQLNIMMSVLFLLDTKNDVTVTEIKACQNRYSLLGTSNNEAKIIEVSLGLTVYLKCDFW